MAREIKIQHRNIGECRVIEDCAYMQRLSADTTSLYVVHDKQLKEVSRNMFDAEALALYDKFCEETVIDPQAA